MIRRLHTRLSRSSWLYGLITAPRTSDLPPVWPPARLVTEDELAAFKLRPMAGDRAFGFDDGGDAA